MEEEEEEVGESSVFLPSPSLILTGLLKVIATDE